MALLRAVAADLAKLPPEDDEHANVPDVTGSYETLEKWLVTASAAGWDGMGVGGPPPVSLESLVSVAETAVHQRSDFTTAAGCVSLFFAREPPRNQVCGPRIPAMLLACPLHARRFVCRNSGVLPRAAGPCAGPEQ